MTVREACDELLVSRSKLYELIRAKKLATIKLGSRSTRIPRAAIEQIVNSWQTDQEGGLK